VRSTPGTRPCRMKARSSCERAFQIESNSDAKAAAALASAPEGRTALEAAERREVREV
jgi:hypothetical protein